MAKSSSAGGSLIRQTNFFLGEVDPQVYKRSEFNGYLTAAQQLLNCEVGTTGLVRKRRGSQFVLDASDYAVHNSVMFEFYDKFNNYYMIMAGEEKFYIFNAPSETVPVVTHDGTLVVTRRGSQVVAANISFDFIMDVDSPYSQMDLGLLDYTNDADSIIFSHPNHPPARIWISDYTTDPFTFSYAALDIYPPPTYDFNTVNYAGAPVTFTNPTATTFRIVLTLAAGPAAVYTNDWINGIIIGLGASDTDPIGYGIITAVSHPTATTVQFDGNVVVSFAAAADMPTIGSRYSIRQPAWSDDLGWPAHTFYYQGRLWFGNTASLPTTVFGSKINNPINFDVGTGRDVDAIVSTIGHTDCGPITWLNGGKQFEIYTANLEFVCPQDTNTALTPSTFTIRQQSAYGSSSYLKPLSYVNNSYYASKTGKSLVNFNFTGVGLAYQSTNISVISQHLAKNPTARALLRGTDSSQDNIIYFLNPDHTLTAFQFQSEVKLAALTPVEFESDVELIDIVSINNVIYILKYYVLAQRYAVERLTENVKIDGYITKEMPDSGVITGLEQFNGYTVQVVYENQDLGEYPVADGTITVNNPNNIADTVSIGLLYNVTITPMYIFGGRNNAPIKKKISRVYIDYYNSLDFSINGYLVPYQNFADIQAGLPLEPREGTAIFDPVYGYNRFETLSITQRAPFDLQILSIAYEVKVAMI